VKLGDDIFRADLVADHGETVTITTRLDDISHAFETYVARGVECEVGDVRHTVSPGSSDEIEIELVRRRRFRAELDAALDELNPRDDEIVLR